MKKKFNKIVLAYSGGLDTSVILHWLKETYQAEVVVFTADIGQEHDPLLVEERANTIGACKVIIEDLKEEFVSNYVFPMFRANKKVLMLLRTEQLARVTTKLDLK